MAQYIVGDLANFTEEDPRFDVLEEAAISALEQSMADVTIAFGVWHDLDNECLAVAYGGEIYWK